MEPAQILKEFYGNVYSKNVNKINCLIYKNPKINKVNSKNNFVNKKLLALNKEICKLNPIITMSALSDFYFNPAPSFICGKEIPSIIKDFDPNCPSVVDRFFAKYFYQKPDSHDEDHMILFHSNRICLVGLAPSHIALRKGIKSVTFNIGNSDRSQNQCIGKGKKGAMNLQPTTTLALITCMDDSEYRVFSCITGKLIEVNLRVVQTPELVAKEGDGYVAICLPKIENCEQIKAGLLSKEQYDDIVKNRAPKESTVNGVDESG